MFLWLLFDYQIHLVIKWDLFPPGCCACAQRRWGHFCRGSGCTPCCEMSAQGYSSSVRWGRRALAGALKEAASNWQPQETDLPAPPCGAVSWAWSASYNLWPRRNKLASSCLCHHFSKSQHTVQAEKYHALQHTKVNCDKEMPNVQRWHLNTVVHALKCLNCIALDKIKL